MVLLRSNRRIARCIQSTGAKIGFNACLVFALFGGGLWQLSDFPDDPSNMALDILMTTVFVLFCVEVVLNLMADSHYFLSFFFFMDVLGTVSMIFEVSYILGPAGKVNTQNNAVDPVFMRTARVAKTAARAGRFLKLTKCLDIIIRPGRAKQANSNTAKFISSKVMFAVSTKVSLLTIVMVIMIPLFQIGQYPEEDLSMKAWGQRLEDSYSRSVQYLKQNPTETSTSIFETAVDDMQGFYAAINYFPFELEGYPEDVVLEGREVKIPGAHRLAELSAPSRKQNIVKQEVSDCKVDRASCSGGVTSAIFFNFEDAKRREDGVDMLLSIVVILVMFTLTSNLTLTMDRLVVKPLERMLQMVREVGSTILKLTTEEEEDTEGDLGIFEETPDETLLLERVFDKLQKIASIALQDNVVDTKDMSLEAKGVVCGMMNMQAKEDEDGPTVRSAQSQKPSQPVAAVAKLPVPEEVLDSWDLDVLSVDEDGRRQIATHILFDSSIGFLCGSVMTDLETFQAFYTAAMAGYNDQPYHNSIHAVDVMHTVYNLLRVTKAVAWAADTEIYGLLIAALCHDIGHMGRTNPFLVETRHPLAMTYNDASPLENMHCAGLFALCEVDTRDVFRRLDTSQYKSTRKTCVSTILHTDNAHHFEMVKEISKKYEINSDAIEKQAQWGDSATLTNEYRSDVVAKDKLMYLQLFLHFADISNPLKPFDMCKAWAWRVLDEFFDQGDEEKRLGIPVGMLNDRDKVNRPGSQHGFVNFLVAPLVFGSVKIFPMLHTLSSQMADNLVDWRDFWVKEAGPSAEEISKRDVDVDRIRATAEELRSRVGVPVMVGQDGARSSKVLPVQTRLSAGLRVERRVVVT